MRKIICGCGCASFHRVCALFDTGGEKQMAVIEKIYAYKCLACGNEYLDSEIENFVLTSPWDDRVILYREVD